MGRKTDEETKIYVPHTIVGKGRNKHPVYSNPEDQKLYEELLAELERGFEVTEYSVLKMLLSGYYRFQKKRKSLGSQIYQAFRTKLGTHPNVKNVDAKNR